MKNAYIDLANLTVETGKKNEEIDFASLVKFWKNRNVKVKIISPADPNKCSYLLKKDNNSVTYLKQILDLVKVSKIINEKALDEDETS